MNFGSRNLRFLSLSVRNQSCQGVARKVTFPKAATLAVTSLPQRPLMDFGHHQRNFSTFKRPLLGSFKDVPDKDIPKLSDLAHRTAPNLIHYLRSLFFVHAIIGPYFDPEFSRSDFKAGAAKAVEVVSDALSRGDFEALEPIVERSCLDDIKRKLSFTTAEQRKALKVKADEIYNDFIYEVGIMLDDAVNATTQAAAGAGGKNDRYVEITYVAHTHPEARKVLGNPQDIESMEQFIQSNPVILNYRFLRRYRKGDDPDQSSWTVSALNHFSLKQLVSSSSSSNQS